MSEMKTFAIALLLLFALGLKFAEVNAINRNIKHDNSTVVGSSLLIENDSGFLRFGEEAGGSNNELEIGTKRDDMPKIRLIGRFGHLGSISFNHWRDDGKQEEILQIVGKVNESDPSSLGGQIEFWLRKNRSDGDEAMMLMGVMTAAYTKDGKPMIRWHERTKIGLDEFMQSETSTKR